MGTRTPTVRFPRLTGGRRRQIRTRVFARGRPTASGARIKLVELRGMELDRIPEGRQKGAEASVMSSPLRIGRLL